MYVGLAVHLLLISLSVQIISWIGKDAIVTFLSSSLFYVSNPNARKKERALKAEILKHKAELAATSSQDEFAKWARLRRKVDKSLTDLEALKAENNKKPAATLLKASLFLLTTVLPFLFSAWNKKEPVFFLPPRWLGPLEYWLGLPQAPLGAISCGIWTMACKRTITVFKGVIDDLRDTTNAIPIVEETPAEKTPVAVPVAQ